MKKEILNKILSSSLNENFTFKENEYKIDFKCILDNDFENYASILETIKSNTKFRYKFYINDKMLELSINISDFEELDLIFIKSLFQINKFKL